MRFAQIVMGPAGTGKSTYCSSMEKHARATQRNIQIVNLDPAAEKFEYEPLVDIRELIQVDDVMDDEDLKLGPNGALVYCMQFFLEHLESWLLPKIGEDYDNDYLIFDLPGQIELYTHLNMMPTFIKQLESWSFRVCGIYTIDAHFLTDASKFIAGSLTALSTIINTEIPHINVLTKIDLLSKKDRKNIEKFLEPNSDQLLEEEEVTPWNTKFMKLSSALGRVLDNFSLVKYVPLNIQKESSLEDLILMADQIMGVSEDADVKFKETAEENDDETMGDIIENM